MSFLLHQQRKKILHQKLLQKQDEPADTSIPDSSEGTPLENRVYWRSHQSDGYDSRLQWREGENGQFYYDSRRGSRSFGNLPEAFLNNDELSRVLAEVRNTTNQNVPPETAARLFASALGETDGEGLRTYASAIASEHGGDARDYISQIEERASGIRREALSSLRQEGIYTTDYVNANPPDESDEADVEAVEEEIQPIPVSETLTSDDVRQQLMNNISIGNVFGAEAGRDSRLRDKMYLSDGLLRGMLSLHRSTYVGDDENSPPEYIDGEWTQDKLDAFTRFYNNSITGHLFNAGRQNFNTLVERLNESGTTEQRELAKKVVSQFYKNILLRLAASGGPAVANSLDDNVRNQGLDPGWMTAMALVSYRMDGTAGSSESTLRDLKSLMQEEMQGQDIEGISQEDYENLNQFGKDMLDQTEIHSGSTMAQITKYAFEKGATQVLTDAGDLVMPAHYYPLSSLPQLLVKVPQSQQGKPLRTGTELPRGLIEAAQTEARKVDSENQAGDEGKTENFTEWMKRESKTFENNFDKATRVAARALEKTGSPLSAKLTNFEKGEVKNAVGSITRDSEWLRKNLPSLQNKSREWKTFWGTNSPLYRHLSGAINRVVQSWRNDRPDDFNKWDRGWGFAYGIIDRAYTNIANSSGNDFGYEQATVVTDAYGGIAAASFWSSSTNSMSVSSAGTHPLYMPEYPYEQIEARLSEQAASENDTRLNRALRSFRSMRPLRRDQRGTRGIHLNTVPGAHLFGQLARTFLENPDFKYMSTSQLTDSVGLEYKKAGMMHPPHGSMQVTRLHMIRYLLKRLPSYVPLEQVTSASGETKWSPIKKQVDYLLMDMDDAIDDMEDDEMDEMFGLTPTSFGPFIESEEKTNKNKKDKKDSE